MAQKWLVGYSTKNPQRAFKTKREACNWALENLIGTFIIWKGEVGVWKEKNGGGIAAKLLKDATAAEVIVHAAKLGYTFTIEDVLEIKRGSSLPLDLSKETVAEAVEDYLSAVER
jgi:hypothetical protein